MCSVGKQARDSCGVSFQLPNASSTAIFEYFSGGFTAWVPGDFSVKHGLEF
jgi:hypothetical protein